MLLHEIPPGSLAQCVLKPAGCPIDCFDIIARGLDGSFEPAIPTHETFTGREYGKVANFDLMATGLTSDDLKLLQRVRARWADRTFTGNRWSVQFVAAAMGRFREAQRAHLREATIIAEIAESFEGTP